MYSVGKSTGFASLFCTAEAPSNEAAAWIEPRLVCTVRYMMKTGTGGMRQPVFKGLRDDKARRSAWKNDGIV